MPFGILCLYLVIEILDIKKEYKEECGTFANPVLSHVLSLFLIGHAYF